MIATHGTPRNANWQSILNRPQNTALAEFSKRPNFDFSNGIDPEQTSDGLALQSTGDDS